MVASAESRGGVCKDCVTAGTRPVLVLTRQPRLILELAVLIGHDQAAFEPLRNLLADMGTDVQSDFDENLTDDCPPVFKRVLRLLVAGAVSLFFSTGFR